MGWIGIQIAFSRSKRMSSRLRRSNSNFNLGDKMKIRNIALIVLFIFCFLAKTASALITNVPPVLTAPMVFYDEGGNVLADGSYGVTIELKDIQAAVLYEEEQVVSVVNGVAALSIGLGSEVGSDYSLAAAGLSLDVFQTGGDVTVEIMVEGQSTTHTAAILGSQPYAFISEYALSVAPDVVSSVGIMDGTIVSADLDPAFLLSLQTTMADDASDDVLHDADLAQSLEVVAETYLNKDGSLIMTGNLDLGGNDVTNIGSIDGVDVAALRTEVNNLDAVFATNDELATHAALTVGVHGLSETSLLVGTTQSQTLQNKFMDATNSISGEAIDSGIIDEARIDSDLARDSEVSSLSEEVTVHESRIDTLEEDAEILEDEVPAPIRPFAYGNMRRTTCSGYNIDSDCTFTTDSSHDDYYVIMTPQGSAGCGSYAGECRVLSKATTGFTIQCTCPSGGTWNPTVDFLVFSKN